MYQSAENRILTAIKKCGRGKVYLPNDFTNIATNDTIRKSLENLTKRGAIVRVARGVYYYPKFDKVLQIDILPTVDQIAEALAKKDKIRIIPTGLYALNRLGLSTQVPTTYMYLTDGISRNFELFDGQVIRFKHTTPKIFQYNHYILQLLVLAMKELGQNNITPEEHKRICEVARMLTKEQFQQDSKLMPIWISQYLAKVYE